MPLLSELSDFIDPTAGEEDDPYAVGENVRPRTHVGEEVGRRAIQKIQPELEGKSVGGFLSNLGSDVGDFAQGTWSLATYPVTHPTDTVRALSDLPHTAERLADTVVSGYKENYTPHDDESVPGMLLRRLYEKPFTSLMDASAVGQLATGGTAPLVRAAGAVSTADALEGAAAIAKRLDPISMALDTGTAILKSKAPGALAELRTTQAVTDATAERTALMRAARDQFYAQVDDAFGDLNPAERHVIHPYIAGRVNFERPMSEQLLTSTGEWAPIKGEVIRPDALEAARQAYIPLQQEMLQKLGRTPQQIGETFGQKAMNDARKFLGDDFDPIHPAVQQYVGDTVTEAVRKNEADLKARAAGEVITALDIAKQKKWSQDVEAAVTANTHASIADAESALPRPEPTSIDEALRAMGPQGGIYFPHSAEAFTRDQSTIGNFLMKMGEAQPWKTNTGALQRAGVLEHQDPVKALMRNYSVYAEGKSWLAMGRDAAEQGVKDGYVTRMPKDWSYATDPDVIAGTHQPFHPGKMLSEEMTEEEGQRLVTRLLEVSDTEGVKELNMPALMESLAKGAEDGPMRPQVKSSWYKVPTQMGHALKDARDAMIPPTNPLLRAVDGFSQWWNYTNLNLRGTRILNNVVGNTMFAVMQGVHPFSVKGMQSLVAIGRAMGAKAGLLSDEGSQALSRVFELPGIRSGGLQSSVDAATGPVGERLLESRNPLARGVGRGGEMLARANQNIESAYRAASLFYDMAPGGLERMKRMTGHASEAMSLSEKIGALAEAGGEVSMKTPEYRAALRQVNRYFNNYDRATPFERGTVRRFFPYYKFFKHSTDLITRFPFEHPLKGQLAARLGAAAKRDTQDILKQWGMDWNRDVPPHLQDSLPIMAEDDPDHPGQKRVWLANTKGANPFSQVSGYLAEQTLQMFNPVVRVALEQATGINLFTRERYRGAVSSMTGREVDPRTGQIVDTFETPGVAESFLRSFWPYNTVKELVAQGRVPTDTASLLDMVTHDPEAWQYDKRGFPRRLPVASSAKRALGRMAGPVPVAITAPNKAQRAQRKGTVNAQLATLMQRYPDRRDDILAAIRSSADEVMRER